MQIIKSKKLVVQTKCPCIAGTAVYKARTLYARYAPAVMFDDLKLCNAVGVYKTSGNNHNALGNKVDVENNYLRGLVYDYENFEERSRQLLVYPNPTNSELHIKYHATQDSKLQVVNMLGVVVKEIYLSKNVQHVLTTINELTPGIYLYRQVDNEKILSSGKLIIAN